MKKLLPIVAIVLGLSFVVNAQVARRLFLEEFTNASCPPCAAQNPAFNAILVANYDKHVSLKYQTVWPGVDPMNAQNQSEVANRVTYYGVTGVPNVEANGVIVDGGSFPGAPNGVTQDFIDEKVALTSPLEVKITHSLAKTLDTMTIRVVVKNVTATNFTSPSLLIHTAITEKAIAFPTAPGTNGEKEFFNVMRKMLPDANGSKVAGNSIAAGDSVVLSWKVFVPFYIYKYDQLSVVAFVQDNDSKEVFQSNISEPQPLKFGNFGDVSITSTSIIPGTSSGYCNYNVTPRVTIKNTGSKSVSSVGVRYAINGASYDTLWTGSLVTNASQVITFPVVQATPGRTTLTFQLLGVNGTRDTVGFNNNVNPVSFTTISDKVFGSTWADGFESTVNGENPVHAIQIEDAANHVNVVDKAYFGAAANAPSMGGYQKSEKSTMFYFWTPGMNAKKASLMYEKMDFTNSKNLKLTFDHAYAQFEGTEQDKLEVRASYDCGKTWTTIWSKAGAALTTAPPVANPSLPFFPDADQWVSDTIKLTALEGKPEVNLQFLGTSAFGDNCYIDNINVSEFVSVSNDDINVLEGNVFVYPNPANEQVTIDVNLPETLNLTVTIADATGRVITTLVQDAEFGSGLHKLNWNTIESGLYLIKIRTEKGTVTRKITVNK